jgi:hypothetical protein
LLLSTSDVASDVEHLKAVTMNCKQKKRTSFLIALLQPVALTPRVLIERNMAARDLRALGSFRESLPR